jgi:gliding motility-associated protein GldE
LTHPLNIFFDLAVYSTYLLAADPQANSFLLALVIMLLLILSFFLSTAEVAFFSMGYKEVSLLKTRKDSSWKKIAELLEDPGLLMASLRIAGIMVNIALVLLLSRFIDHIVDWDGQWRGSGWGWLIKIPVITLIVLLLGSLLPRLRAAQNPLRAAYESAQVAELVFYLFRRMALVMVRFSKGVEAWAGGAPAQAQQQEEIEQAIRSTVPEAEEQRLLTGIYKFPHTLVRQVMRIRLDVSGIDHNSSFGELKSRIAALHYSRLPVYRGSLDEIKGVVHTKDILPYLEAPDDFDWRHLVRPPYFVHEQKPVEDLLKEFQNSRIHFAIVIDEFGGTSGIVTLEDILEEIVGDIRDEFDEEESTNKKLEDGSYLLEGRSMIHEACALMGVPANTFDAVKGDNDTIAGLLLEQAGEIPLPDTVIRIGDFIFTVQETGHNRILRVRLQIDQRFKGAPEN